MCISTEEAQIRRKAMKIDTLLQSAYKGRIAAVLLGVLSLVLRAYGYDLSDEEAKLLVDSGSVIFGAGSVVFALFSKIRESLKGNIVKILLPFLFICPFLFTGIAQAEMKNILPTVSWDGKDSAGNTEGSLPVTITLYEAISDTVLSQAFVNGSVVDFNMPVFSIDVVDNQTTSLSVYATAADSAGNTSPRSQIYHFYFEGKDTIAPGVPVLKIIADGVTISIEGE